MIGESILDFITDGLGAELKNRIGASEFYLFLSLNAACGNVGAPAPDGRIDAQLLGDFVDRGILRKPLESVDHGLFVRHGQIVPLRNAQRKKRVELMI